MAGYRVYQQSDPAVRMYAPQAASSTFDAGDPVQLNNEYLAATPADESVAQETEIIGFAAEAAEGNQSNTRQNLSYGNGDFGASTGRMTAYVPVDAPGLLMATDNYWSDPTTDPPTAGTIDGNLTGLVRQMVAADYTGTTDEWGIDTTVKGATDAGAFIVAVLDADGNPVHGATVGTTIVFRVLAQDTQVNTGGTT